MTRSFSSPPTDQKGIFFSLPLELRDCIYFLLLASNRPIRIEYNRPAYIGARPRLIQSPIPAGSAGLLRVCQWIHEEAEPILYTLNQFAISMHDELPLFLTSISPRAYTLIEDLILGWPQETKQAKEGVDLLIGCRGLKRLSIERVYEPIPNYMLPLLEGLRLREVYFHPRSESTNRLSKIITDPDCPRTLGQRRKAKEQRDDKVSGINAFDLHHFLI
jgi:hypothetical protein